MVFLEVPYNPNNQRIKKTVNGSSIWYLYDNQRLLAEFNNSGTLNKRYAYLPGAMAPVQMTDSNGTYQIHNDHLATPKLLTNSSEVVVWKAEHQAFGKAVVDEDPDNNSTNVTLNIRYPGQYFDSETGLHYNWHRYYDPNTGRYLQRDWLGLMDGPNPYTYVRQNPLNLWDFTGLAVTMPSAPPPGWCMNTDPDGTFSFYPCDNPPDDPPKDKCPKCPEPPPADPDEDPETPDDTEDRPKIDVPDVPSKPDGIPTNPKSPGSWGRAAGDAVCGTATNCVECMACCLGQGTGYQSRGGKYGPLGVSACNADCAFNYADSCR